MLEPRKIATVIAVTAIVTSFSCGGSDDSANSEPIKCEPCEYTFFSCDNPANPESLTLEIGERKNGYCTAKTLVSQIRCNPIQVCRVACEPATYSNGKLTYDDYTCYGH